MIKIIQNYKSIWTDNSMSEKDLALSQSSQRRFSRTIGSKVLIQR